MPHHWRPGDVDQTSDEMKKCQYRGKDKDEVWELCPISDEEAADLRKKPKRHECERVLDDLPLG
jgi:hypothetical protein